MKSLIIIALALVLGAGLIWVADFEPGFVLLQYASWSLETSLVVFVVGFILLLVTGYFALRSIVLLRQAPKNLSLWTESRRQQRVGKELTRGLTTLEEGRWVEAERLLIRHVSNSGAPLLHYLGAARAAQKQEALDRRDNYLRLASETTEGSDLAVGVVQVELQIAAGQKELALTTLEQLRDIAPKHPYVLQLLQQLYLERNEWQNIQGVLPDLRKRNVLDSNAALALTQDAVVGRLESALAEQDWQTVADLWQKASNKQKQTEALLVPYIESMVQQGESIRAIELIEQFMNKKWSDSLIYQYGLLSGTDELKRLAKAEKWLKDHTESTDLLLTLGRLAQSNQLWAKAEAYLRSSLEFSERGETYLVLAEVMESEGRPELAAGFYKQGLTSMLVKVPTKIN